MRDGTGVGRYGGRYFLQKKMSNEFIFMDVAFGACCVCLIWAGLTICMSGLADWRRRRFLQGRVLEGVSPFRKESCVHVLFDIECSGPFSENMFAIAMGVLWWQGGERHERSLVWYFPEEELDTSRASYIWWQGEKDGEDGKARKRFFDYAHAHPDQLDVASVAGLIRDEVDVCYGIAEGLDKRVCFWGDFPVFDIGKINDMLKRHGGHLPVYLKNDGARPARIVNYNSFAGGLMRGNFMKSVRKQLLQFGKMYPEKTNSHDSEVDIGLLLRELEVVLELYEELQWGV